MNELSIDDYSRLSPDRVIDAVEHTGRLSDARILALNSYENRVYQVGIEEALPVIAKFYRPARWSEVQIREEHTFSLELAAAELPVVAPLMAENGETLFEFERYRYALFPRKGGQAPEPGDLDQLHRIGMLLGRMHAVSNKQGFVHRPQLTIERFIDAPAVVVQAPGFLPAPMRERYMLAHGQLRKKINLLPWQNATWIRTHGDCHPGNVLWTRDDGPWLVDFDDCQSAPAVQDLWMMLTSSRQEQELQLAELLDGYSMFCDFDVQELHFVEALRTMRMVHYAGWLASRWNDPAFPRHFPWFNTSYYWQQHVAELELQVQQMEEEPLRCL